MYNVDALKRGIESAKKNIKTFEDAILKEKEMIKEYRFMIKHLEEKAKLQEEVIVVEVKDDSTE